MGVKNSVPQFREWEWEWKTVLPSLGIGNRNEKQCSKPKLGKNWLKSLGKILGTGIPAHACTRLGCMMVRLQAHHVQINKRYYKFHNYELSSSDILIILVDAKKLKSNVDFNIHKIGFPLIVLQLFHRYENSLVG